MNKLIMTEEIDSKVKLDADGCSVCEAQLETIQIHSLKNSFAF